MTTGVLQLLLQMHEMQPALDYLISQGVLGDDARPHRILTQSMSNGKFLRSYLCPIKDSNDFPSGGCIRLDHLSKLIASKSLKSHPSTRSLMVIDSAPGGDTLECALNAFEVMIPSPFLRYPTIIAFFSVQTLSWILGRTPRLPFEAIRQGILDRNWLPWTALENTDGSKRKTLWLFIYSRVDQLVPFDHVQKLTEAAESHGMDIRREIYEDTPHVAHMRGDPERYWGVIKSCWDGVVKTEVLA